MTTITDNTIDALTIEPGTEVIIEDGGYHNHRNGQVAVVSNIRHWNAVSGWVQLKVDGEDRDIGVHKTGLSLKVNPPTRHDRKVGDTLLTRTFRNPVIVRRGPEHAGGRVVVEYMKQGSSLEGKLHSREQVDLIDPEPTNLTKDDVREGDKVRMVYPGLVPSYVNVFGKTGVVMEVHDGMLDGLVDVDFDGKKATCLISRLDMVEKNMAVRMAEEAKRREAQPDFENGARIVVTKPAFTVEAPLSVIEQLSVGTEGVIVHSYLDGDYEVSTDLGVFFVAGACLEAAPEPEPKGSDLVAGDRVTSVEQLNDMGICAVVQNKGGAIFVKNCSTRYPVTEGWTVWTGATETADWVFKNMGELTVVQPGLS